MTAPRTVGDHVQLAAARADFLEVGLQLVQQLVVRGHRDHRHVLVDQRQRAVLELAGRVGFGMDVGDFLELQGAFQRDRIVRPRPRNRAWCLSAKRSASSAMRGLEFECLLTATRQTGQLDESLPSDPRRQGRVGAP
jgi:hypothetical protein